MIFLLGLLLGFAGGVFVWVPLYIRWDEQKRRMDREWIERQRRGER